MSVRIVLLSVLWACLSSWYYGFHLSELNYPISSLTCISIPEGSSQPLPLCLGLSTNLYGVVTAIFTAGGLIGSLISSGVVEKYGMKGGITLTGWLNLFGSLAMALAPHWVVLAAGRLTAGLSSGLAVCLVPPFLSLICKSVPELQNRSGQIGTLHQLAIVLGICAAQVAGLLLTGKQGDIPGSWRHVVIISGGVSLLQILVARWIPHPQAEMLYRAIEDPAHDDADVASPLLSNSTDSTPAPEAQLSLRYLLSNPNLRRPTLLVASILALQQLSGVNAVLFYSTPVLRPLLPTGAGVLGVGITVVNALMTLPAVFLVDRLGRKTLLLGSILGMTTMSVLLAIGLDGHYQVMSAVAIVSFIVRSAQNYTPPSTDTVSGILRRGSRSDPIPSRLGISAFSGMPTLPLRKHPLIDANDTGCPGAVVARSFPILDLQLPYCDSLPAFARCFIAKRGGGRRTSVLHLCRGVGCSGWDSSGGTGETFCGVEARRSCFSVYRKGSGM
ncbi:hypothetical protein P7C73_g2353, partial [Tremellales sp. Uapishka_1]